MDAARIADLLQPFLGHQALPHEALNQTSMYIDLLLRWNARINLTAVRDPESIVTRHFGESFFLAQHLFPHCAPQCDRDVTGQAQEKIEDMSNSARVGRLASVIDIGSGAGFPALPIKIWAPDIALTLIEANHKKATFLREVTRALTLIDVNVMNDRAEHVAAMAEFPSAEIVTLRAVEHFDEILRVAAKFVAPQGRLVLLIGSAQMRTASTVLPSFAWSEPSPIPLSRSRVLSFGRWRASS
jgi:16S rRNA (guanine527-N7)-methyltransferase